MKSVEKVGEDDATSQRKKRGCALSPALGAIKAITEYPAPCSRKAEVHMLETLAGGLRTPSLADGAREVARKGRHYMKRVGEPKLEQIEKAGEDVQAERELAERDAEEEQKALRAHEKNRAGVAMDLVGCGVKRTRPEKAANGSTGRRVANRSTPQTRGGRPQKWSTRRDIGARRGRAMVLAKLQMPRGHSSPLGMTHWLRKIRVLWRWAKRRGWAL